MDQPAVVILVVLEGGCSKVRVFCSLTELLEAVEELEEAGTQTGLLDDIPE